MGFLEGLGLLGLFIGTFLAATVLPFSSDALYLAILAATKDTLGCLVVGTLGNWLGSVATYWIGWIARWDWLEKWFNVRPETGSDMLGTVHRRCHRDSARILQDATGQDNASSPCRKVPEIPLLELALRLRGLWLTIN